MGPHHRREDGFDTLTHARIRAGQGDRSGARRIVREILRRDPWNREALEYFHELAGRDRVMEEPAAARDLDRPVAATAGELSEQFRQVLDPADDRIRRLHAWLGRISDRQGGQDAG